MTQANHSPIRYDDEVLRFWAAQARQQQEAQEAMRRYLCDRIKSSPIPADLDSNV